MFVHVHEETNEEQHVGSVGLAKQNILNSF